MQLTLSHCKKSMNHRLRVYEAQAAVAQTPVLRAQYKTNMEQIRSMMGREATCPTSHDSRTLEREIAAQILALDATTPPP